MKNIFIKVLTILLLNSCVSIQNKNINNNVILSIQHGGCYGTCPIYTISLYDDARIVYHGKRFVEHQGLYESYLNKHDFKQILSLSDNTFMSSEDIIIKMLKLGKMMY